MRHTGRRGRTPKRATAAAAGLGAAAALLAGGCRTRPPPARGEIQQEALGHLVLTGPWKARGAVAGPIADDWLASFNDPQLDALVGEAVASNPDLRVGAARLEQVAGYVRLARAALLPAVNLFGRGSTKMGESLDNALSGAILSVSWEIDLWGRLRYARNAAQEADASARADYELALQSIAATTARNWFTATETLMQTRLGEAMVQAAEQLAALAETRRRIGSGDERDVVLAQASAAAYRDGVKHAGLAHEQALRALELLLGRYPGAEIQARPELPTLPGPVPAGMPLEMLERRPDLIAAERRVAAAFNRVGEAKAARLPRISLTGSAGYVTSEVIELKPDFDNVSAGLGASLLAPIYQGGALKSQVEIRTSEQQEAVAEYARMAQRAIGDVENALAASQTLEERERILQEAVARNQRGLELEQAAYRVGAADMRAVLQQQLALHSASVTLLRVQSEQLTQRVNLHLVLGGSFRTADPTTPAAADDQGRAARDPEGGQAPAAAGREG